MVEWRTATRSDIEKAVSQGMVEPVGIDAAGILRLAVAGLEHSIDSRAYFVGGEMVCVVGLVAESIISEECHLWATFLPVALKTPKIIGRHTRAYVEGLPYERVTCLCDPDFANTVRWVKWMGFTLIGEHVIMGKAYDLFERRA